MTGSGAAAGDPRGGGRGLRVLTVVGARPQFIKAAAVTRVIASRPAEEISEILVHTGQHHDTNMSRVFFDELGVPDPDHNLGISGGTHGAMTGRMLMALERTMLEEKPDWVLIYGDTNSTLAGAVAAAKLHIPVAHVEAGLRSFNMRMPEEVNRVVADRLAALLLCPTRAAVDNLSREGLTDGVHLVGDVMYDVALHAADRAARVDVPGRFGVSPRSYVLATCHRAENTDDPARLAGIARGLSRVAESQPVVLPLHPRTRDRLTEFGLLDELAGVQVTEPVSYLEMVALERNAEVIVTDSGGVQKEALFYRVPCVTTRAETEWVETVSAGWNTLVDADPSRLVEEVEGHAGRRRLETAPYGDGEAAEKIVDVLLGA